MKRERKRERSASTHARAKKKKKKKNQKSSSSSSSLEKENGCLLFPLTGNKKTRSADVEKPKKNKRTRRIVPAWRTRRSLRRWIFFPLDPPRSCCCCCCLHSYLSSSSSDALSLFLSDERKSRRSWFCTKKIENPKFFRRVLSPRGEKFKKKGDAQTKALIRERER